ncbi:glycosyltransferase family 2 protein [Euzebya tangerina]|uniref:glycosyltransferase family 2 protein n=1 Tax=Euzebya tangerina TaxID=591198 RepID=UPI0023E820C3|nr:glycosyltransferase family 2 protein [Euzebya tangerina]
MPSQPLHLWNRRPTPAAGSGWTPTVSVVIPHYRSVELLRNTVAGLAQQDYPLGRMQVIVVDDGSPVPPRPPDLADADLSVDLIHQRRDGFGAGRARNRGADAAEGDVLVFLDADVIPSPTFLTQHVALHESVDYAVAFGERTHVDIARVDAETMRQRLRDGHSADDLLADLPTRTVAWREAFLRETAHLTTDRARGWRLCNTGNLSMRRSFFTDVGGFDERFWGWGGEDIEWAYRALQAGALLTHHPEAHGWHQGLEGATTASERASQAAQARFLASLIADSEIRAPFGPRLWEVPRVAVEIAAAAADDGAVEMLVDGLLAELRDVIIALDDGGRSLRLLRGYASEPRVLLRPESVPARPEADPRPEQSWWPGLPSAAAAPTQVIIDQPDLMSAHDIGRALQRLDTDDPRPVGVRFRAAGGAVAASAWSTQMLRRATRCGEDLLAGQIPDGWPIITETPQGPPRASIRSARRRQLPAEVRQLWWRLPSPVRHQLDRLRSGGPR